MYSEHTDERLLFTCGMQMWIAKAEYDESGPSIVHRKCFYFFGMGAVQVLCPDLGKAIATHQLTVSLI